MIMDQDAAENGAATDATRPAADAVGPEGGAGAYTEANREAWNTRTRAHVQSAFYDVEGFKAGKNRLRAVELAELTDVAGKSLLHLQCHFGLDTLSWARLGAQVTGADLSDESITFARALAAEVGIPATFVCADLYSLPDVLDGQFDIVFTSYGVLGYLRDLTAWGRLIAHFLKPGGTFYIVEFHPFRGIFDMDVIDSGSDEFHELRVAYPYFYVAEPERVESTSSYAAAEGSLRTVLYVWGHSMGEIITALSAAGLRIEFLHEFPIDPAPHLPEMEQDESGWWRFKNPLYREAVPLLFSIKATKPAAPG
jgi:SAM-dependent methyltransferase